MAKAYDGPFDFRGIHDAPSRCHLRIYRHPNRPVIVVATELADNPGSSVTNALPGLADAVCSSFDIDPDVLLWVEHYPADRFTAECIQRVDLASDRGPAWFELSQARLEELTGDSFARK